MKRSRYFRLLREINFKDTSKDIFPCDILFFCHDANRGIELNGEAYSPLIDSYREEFEAQGLTTQVIATPWSLLVGNLASGNVHAINRSYFFALIKSKVLKIDYRKKLYKKLLRKSMPKNIISIGCDSSLCQAARELKIPHAELLHGLGYSDIPWGWDKKKKNHLPQEIIALDDISQKTFKALAHNDIQIKRIEHPFLKRFSSHTIVDLPNEWLVNRRRGFEKEVLISLQWGYAKELDCCDEFLGVINNGLFPYVLSDLIQKTRDKIFWRFRFHPVHLSNKKKYTRHFKLIQSLVDQLGNCEWAESSEKPLPSVLMCCDGHITMSSMSSYDAAYMGVKTLALCPTLRDGGINENMFLDLVENNYLEKADASLCVLDNWISNVVFDFKMSSDKLDEL